MADACQRLIDDYKKRDIIKDNVIQKSNYNELIRDYEDIGMTKQEIYKCLKDNGISVSKEKKEVSQEVLPLTGEFEIKNTNFEPEKKEVSQEIIEEVEDTTDIFDELPVVFIGIYSFDNKQLVDNFGDKETSSDKVVSLLKRVFQKKYPITRKNEMPKVPSKGSDKELLIKLLQNYFEKLRRKIIRENRHHGNSMTLRQKIDQLQQIKLLKEHFEESKERFPYHLFEQYIGNEDYIDFKGDLEKQFDKIKFREKEEDRIRSLLRQFAKLYLLQRNNDEYTLSDPGESEKRFQAFIAQFKEKIPEVLVKLIKLLKTKIQQEDKEEPDYYTLQRLLKQLVSEYNEMKAKETGEGNKESSNPPALVGEKFATSSPSGGSFTIPEGKPINENIESFIRVLFDEYKRLKEEKQSNIQNKESQLSGIQSELSRVQGKLSRLESKEEKRKAKKEARAAAAARTTVAEPPPQMSATNTQEAVADPPPPPIAARDTEEAVADPPSPEPTNLDLASLFASMNNNNSSQPIPARDTQEVVAEPLTPATDIQEAVVQSEETVQQTAPRLESQSEATQEVVAIPTQARDTQEVGSSENKAKLESFLTDNSKLKKRDIYEQEYENVFLNSNGKYIFPSDFKNTVIAERPNYNDAIKYGKIKNYKNAMATLEIKLAPKKLLTKSIITTSYNIVKSKYKDNSAKLKEIEKAYKTLQTIKLNDMVLVSKQQGGSKDPLYKYCIQVANDRLDEFLIDEPLPFFGIIESFDKSIIRETNEKYLLELFVEHQLQEHFTSDEMKDFFTQFQLIFDKTEDLSQLCFVLYEICNSIKKEDDVDTVRYKSTEYNSKFDKLEQILKTSSFDFYDTASKQLHELEVINIKYHNNHIYFKTDTDSFENTYEIDSKLNLEKTEYDYNEELYSVNNKLVYFFFILSVYNTIKSDIKDLEIVDTLLKHTRTTKRNLKRPAKKLIKDQQKNL